MVWEYINPVVSGEAVAQGTTLETSQTRTGETGDPIFRAYHTVDYPAFIGKQWVPQGGVEGDAR